MSQSTDFGDLDADVQFKENINNLEEAFNKIDNSIGTAIECMESSELAAADKVKLLNYLAYSINTLYWINLKLRGEDTTGHGITNELSRVRQTILRAKQLEDYKTRPRVNAVVAKRFVHHGLKISREETNETNGQTT